MTPSASTSGSPLRTGTAAPTDENLGIGESRSPDTLKEAANQFEKVLVRQFVKVMTKDMFSGSHAGKGGGNWMKSQRDRQRDLMTDMITDRLADANTLDVAKTLKREWGIQDSSEEAASASPSALESRPPSSDESSAPARPLLDTPPNTSDESHHIDHAV